MEAKNFVESIAIPKQRPISTIIYEQLLHAIVEGRLFEGERIVESKLAQTFNVSRPPIREALQMLELEGFINLVPYKGYFVTPFTIREVRETLEVKAMVEGYAAWKAATVFGPETIFALEAILTQAEQCVQARKTEKIREYNFQFHHKILAGIENEKLHRYYHGLFNALKRLYAIGLAARSGFSTSLNEHRQILEKIKGRDPDGAETCARQHAMNTIDRVLEKLKERQATQADTAVTTS